MLENEYFRELLACLDQSIANLLSRARATLRRLIMDEYVTQKAVLKNELAQALSDVYLSFDLWTAPNYITSIHVSRDCSHAETWSSSTSYNLRPRRCRVVNHLILFSSSSSTRTSMRIILIHSACRAVDQDVAVVRLCSNSSRSAEMARGVGGVETSCAGFAGASGTPTYICMPAASGSGRCDTNVSARQGV